MADPRSPFNWRTTYQSQVDWSDMVRTTNVSKAATINVNKKGKEGVSLGYVKGMGRPELKAPAQVIVYCRAKG